MENIDRSSKDVIVDEDKIYLKNEFVKNVFKVERGQTVVLICRKNIPHLVADEVMKVFADMGVRFIITSEDRIYDIKSPEQFWSENFPLSELVKVNSFLSSFLRILALFLGCVAVLVAAIKLLIFISAL